MVSPPPLVRVVLVNGYDAASKKSVHDGLTETHGIQHKGDFKVGYY